MGHLFTADFRSRIWTYNLNSANFRWPVLGCKLPSFDSRFESCAHYLYFSNLMNTSHWVTERPKTVLLFSSHPVSPGFESRAHYLYLLQYLLWYYICHWLVEKNGNWKIKRGRKILTQVVSPFISHWFVEKNDNWKRKRGRKILTQVVSPLVLWTSWGRVVPCSVRCWAREVRQLLESRLQGETCRDVWSVNNGENCYNCRSCKFEGKELGYE